MNSELVRQIADAVLYEGYILYPYRRSAIKNQQRWNFGVLYPRSYAEAQTGHDTWSMQTEFLAVAGAEAKLNITIRFLQLVNREVGRLLTPLDETDDMMMEARASGPLDSSLETLRARPSRSRPWKNLPYERVDSLALESGEVFQSWQEAREREVEVPCDFKRLEIAPLVFPFSFDTRRTFAPLTDRDQIIGLIVRHHEHVKGEVVAAAHRETEELYKLHVALVNRTEFGQDQARERALAHSLLSAHIVVEIEDGAFVSQLDPPDEYRSATAACSNVGCWPVLVGANDKRDTMLASPIVLYDYPRIADSSSGDLFDGTEIDEILSLRIMTLTDEEKREMEVSDERARQILQRTEAMPLEQFMKMHGVMKTVNSKS